MRRLSDLERCLFLNLSAGIGNRFAKLLEKPLIYALPERFFAPGLLRINDNDFSQRIDVCKIPSWPWAAWEGQSLYDLNLGIEKLTAGTLVRFYLYNPESGLHNINEDEFWFFRRVNLGALENCLLWIPASRDEVHA